MQDKQVRITKHRPDNCPQYCTEHWNHAKSRVQMPSSHIIMVIRGDTLVGLTTVIISLGICTPSHIIHLNHTQFLLKINKWNFSIARELYSIPYYGLSGKEFNKEQIQVCVQQIRASAVHLEPMQHCQSIIPQYNFFNF